MRIKGEPCLVLVALPQLHFVGGNLRLAQLHLTVVGLFGLLALVLSKNRGSLKGIIGHSLI